MKKIIYFIAGIVMLYSCTSTKTSSMSTDETASSAPAQADGWESLFDGKTTKGWHTYGKKTIGNAWKVQEGVLHLDAASKKQGQIEGGDIVTDEEYGNFDLKLEWKIAPKGNSGIIFFIKEDSAKYPVPWHTGPEMQILDNGGHADAQINKHRAGDLYDLISSSKEAAKQPGEWNAVEIVANGGKLDFYLNGEHIVNTTMWNDGWKQMVAGSKFKGMADFATYKQGRIGLQDHGDNVWFRNIKIKRL